MDSDSYSEDEDSYEKLIQPKTNFEEDSVIDESGDDSSSNNASSDSHSETSNQHSPVLKVKKKAVLRLDSDTDSDLEDDNTTCDISKNVSDIPSVIEQSKQQNAESRESSNRSPMKSMSLLSGKKRSGVIPKSYGEGATNENHDRSSAIVDSDSTDEGESQLGIESFTETPQRNNVAPAMNKSNDVLNLSAKMSTRISNQFEFNSEGILNSTSIHLAEKPVGKWRPSNAVQYIGDIQESSADQSVEILSDNSSDIIEVSSGEQIQSPPKTPYRLQKLKATVRQRTLHSFIHIKSPTTEAKQQSSTNTQCKIPPQSPKARHVEQDTDSVKSIVSKAEYETQWSRVNNLEIDFIKLQNMADNLDFQALPDKGELIKDRLRMAKRKFMEEQLKLNNMEASSELVDKPKEEAPGAFANVAWEDIQAGANAVLPKTFGKQAMSTYNAQKAVTMDRLQQLHGALQTCPKEDDFEEDPKGLKVPLMPHQRRALAWLIFREKEKPSGGILADDMGLGKTLTMISLIVKSRVIEKSEKDSDEENREQNEYIGKNSKFDGGSLIVCPASLINQWSGEIDRRLKRGLLSYNLYHGSKRESRAKKLAEYDVVITTYAIVNNESDKKSALFRIKWRRIILDEAHQIRNYKSQTSESCCQLSGKSRWALTGTPMHNKELDMYALLKFLRCTPFDEIQVWKRWVGDKSRGGQERLHTVISSLMLRRTKAELMEKGSLNCMPEKKWLLVKVELDKQELKVYHKVLIFSQTLFAQFLHQRAEKNQDLMDHKFTSLPNGASNEEYFKMRQKLLKLNKVKNVSQHEILVLLLRLRQICCHPSLITAMLHEGLDDVGEGDEECEELNLLDQLKKLNIDEEEHEDEYKPADETQANINEKVNLKEATKGHLRSSDPIFAKDRPSSKIRHLLKVLKAEVLAKDDKAIIVSQWSSYLDLIALHLKECNVEFDQLDGKVPVHKRMEMVNKFNEPKDPMRVLLLSLTAGGVGLNLVGANHLFLLDLHWNPQLENQAQDRIYRMGQTKPVFVYKFMAIDTIEERIKMLQEKKLAMAEGILTGTRQVVQNKLSLDDLKMIFGM